MTPPPRRIRFIPWPSIGTLDHILEKITPLALYSVYSVVKLTLVANVHSSDTSSNNSTLAASNELAELADSLLYK